jgi:hypothetical protein
MDIQSLQDILYIFLDWHPERILTFSNLILGVIKARTVKNKYAELKSPIPEASLRGISEIFPAELPALSKKNEAGFGELNLGEIKMFLRYFFDGY